MYNKRGCNEFKVASVSNFETPTGRSLNIFFSFMKQVFQSIEDTLHFKLHILNIIIQI